MTTTGVRKTLIEVALPLAAINKAAAREKSTILRIDGSVMQRLRQQAAQLLWNPDVPGNLAHDLHTPVLMREHGVSRLCTCDSGFRPFPFLTVVDPLHESGDR